MAGRLCYSSGEYKNCILSDHDQNIPEIYILSYNFGFVDEVVFAMIEFSWIYLGNVFSKASSNLYLNSGKLSAKKFILEYSQFWTQSYSIVFCLNQSTIYKSTHSESGNPDSYTYIYKQCHTYSESQCMGQSFSWPFMYLADKFIRQIWSQHNISDTPSILSMLKQELLYRQNWICFHPPSRLFNQTFQALSRFLKLTRGGAEFEYNLTQEIGSLYWCCGWFPIIIHLIPKQWWLN